jgi:hypothetical protein
MANEDDIVQRIVLEGNGDVLSAFREIGRVGEEAFEKIKRAAAGGLSAAETIGVTIGVAAGALAGLTGIAFEFTRRMEETVNATKELAHQLGVTTEEATGLRAAFAAGGVGEGQLDQAFRRLATTVQNSWAQIKKESGESADKLKGDALSIEQAQLNLGNSQRTLAQFDRDQADQRVKSSNSVREAELRLRDVVLQQARARGIDTSTQEDSLKRARDRLSLEEAQQALADAQLQKSREAERQEAEATAAQQKVQKDTLDLNAAKRKDLEDQKNDITNVIAAVKKVAEGDGDALKSINASAENVVKGIIGASGDAGKALGSLRGDITDLSSPAPAATQVIETLGKTLANLQDPLLQAAVASRILGRTVEQDLIQVLADPSKIKEFQQRVVDLGLAINSVDVSISDKFRTALLVMQNDISLIGQKIATVFGPTFTSVLNNVDDALTKSKDSIVDFLRVFNDDAIKPFISILGDLISILQSLAAIVAIPFKLMAEAINALLGTDLKALDVFLGAITIPLRIIAATAAAAAAALRLLIDTVRGGGASTTAFGEALGNVLDGVKAIASGDFTKGFEQITKSFDDYGKRVKEIDDLDAQVERNRRNRLDELNKSSEDVHGNLVHDQKDALKKIDEDHKTSVNSRIADNERLDVSSKNSLDQQKRNAAEQSKIAQTPDGRKQLPDGSFLDANGVRTFEGSPGGGITQSLLSAAFRDRGLVPLEGGVALGRGQPLQGFGGNFPVIRPAGAGAEGATEDEKQRKILGDAVKQGIETSRPFSGTGPTGIPTGGLPEQLVTPQDKSGPEFQTARDFENLKAGFQAIKDGISNIDVKIGEAIRSAIDSLGTILKDNAGSLGNQPDSRTKNLAPQDQPVSEAAGKVSTLGDNSETAAGKVAAFGEALANVLASLGGGSSGGDLVAAAGGGLLHGPGSGTSDDILMWGSRGEFMQPERAVSHYGVGMMEAIRSLRFPKFALGGMVGIVPRFANGGSVSRAGVSVSHFGTLDLRTDHGPARIVVAADSVDALHRVAQNKRRSAATKRSPGFVS